MGGFALAQMDVDIGRLEDEDIITEGARIAAKVVGSADGERVTVKPERCADASQVRCRDLLTGTDVVVASPGTRDAGRFI